MSKPKAETGVLEPSENSATHRRRIIIMLLLGLAFLLFITLLSLNITSFLPHRHLTVTNQVAKIGPYQVTLSISPYLPHAADPANLTIQITKQNTHQLVTNATVLLENTMETMDMGTGHNQARLQNNGSYIAHLPFTMSGRWQVRVLITMPDKQTFSAIFEIKAQ